MKKKKVLIFIITYQASYRLLDVFKKIPLNRNKSFDLSVLISDDNSNDDTFQYAKKIKKINKKVLINSNKNNLGYGAHIKKCLIFALKKKFDYAIMIHGDGQYSPIYIDSILKEFKKNSKLSAVTGSRILKGTYNASVGGMPFYKLIGNILLTKIHNFFLNTNFSDAHSGLWGYNLTHLRSKKFINFTNSFNFDQHMRFYYIANNLIIKEIPIKTIYGNERSQLHIIYAIKFFFEIFRFKLSKNNFYLNAQH
jgi:hypothetical protein